MLKDELARELIVRQAANFVTQVTVTDLIDFDFRYDEYRAFRRQTSPATG